MKDFIHLAGYSCTWKALTPLALRQVSALHFLVDIHLARRAGRVPIPLDTHRCCSNVKYSPRTIWPLIYPLDLPCAPFPIVGMLGGLSCFSRALLLLLLT